MHHSPGRRSTALPGAAEAARGLSLGLWSWPPASERTRCLLLEPPKPLPTGYLLTALLTRVLLGALMWYSGGHKGCPKYIANPAFSGTQGGLRELAFSQSFWVDAFSVRTTIVNLRRGF